MDAKSLPRGTVSRWLLVVIVMLVVALGGLLAGCAGTSTTPTVLPTVPPATTATTVILATTPPLTTTCCAGVTGSDVFGANLERTGSLLLAVPANWAARCGGSCHLWASR